MSKKTELMNQTIVNVEHRITSLEIAEMTGKTHSHVMRDIRNMEPAWEKVHRSKFGQMQIREKLPNNGYRLRRVYALTMLESLYIATKYNDETRVRLVIRWADLEEAGRHSQGAGSQYHSGYAQMYQTPYALLETEAEVMKRSDKIQKEKISLANESATGCFTMSQVAHSLGIKYKDLCRLLEEHFIITDENGILELLPPYTGMGYEQYRYHEGYSLEGDRYHRKYMVWTADGMAFVRKQVKRIMKYELDND